MVLYNSYRKVHPGLYRYQDTLSFDTRFHDLYDSIEEPLSYESFFRKAALLNESVKDLHTSVQPSKTWLKGHKKVLPFILREVEGSIYVQYNASDDSTFVRGLEVLEVNGKKVKELVNEISDLLGTDGGNEWTKRYYAVKGFHNYYPRFYSLDDSVSVSVRFEGEMTRVVHLACVDRKLLTSTILKRYPDKKRQNLTYSLEDTLQKAARLDISSFVYRASPIDIFQRKFKRTLKRRFREIKEDSVKHLVLDFRGNGGGYIPNVGRLMKYVSLEPYKLMDTMAFSRNAYFRIFPAYRMIPPLIAPLFFNKRDSHYRFRSFADHPHRKPSKLAFKGELYAMMDPGSYSATVFSLALLNTMNRALLIGSSPGGTTWGSHAGSWYTKTLPNSRIRARIPQFRIVHSQWGRREEKLFLQPNYLIHESLDDFVSDRDAYVEGFKALIVEKKPLRNQRAYDQMK